MKIHGANWTIKAYGPVVGARQPSKTWDVMHVVDPQKIELAREDMTLRQHEATFVLDHTTRKNRERMQT